MKGRAGCDGKGARPVMRRAGCGFCREKEERNPSPTSGTNVCRTQRQCICQMASLWSAMWPLLKCVSFGDIGELRLHQKIRSSGRQIHHQGNNTAHTIVNPPKAACTSPTSQTLPSKGNPRMPMVSATKRPESKKNAPIAATTLRMFGDLLRERPA